MKKLISLLLAMMMVFSLATAAFAAEETGSITIEGVAVVEKEGEEGVYNTVAKYGVFKLLDVVNFDPDDTTGNISYKVTKEWKEFFLNDATAKKYFVIDQLDQISFNDNNEDETTIAKAVAAAAKNYLEAHIATIQPTSATHSIVSGSVNTSSMTANIIFENLPLGYYLIASDMGVLCGLDTTNPNATINAKNTPPTVLKKVQEDSEAASGTSSWGTSNTADIGQLVNFDTTITVALGADRYVLHDKMDKGLDFQAVTEVIRIHTGSGTREKLVEGTDYTVKTDCTDDCDFEVEFTTSLLNKVVANDKIVVLYNALLTQDANIDTANTNESFVEFGDNHFTESSKTETFTYKFDLVKIDSVTKQKLSGAKFKLSYSSDLKGEPITLVLMNAGEKGKEGFIPKLHIYHANDAAHDGFEKVEEFELPNGQAELYGLDKGTYYLIETEAPANYNILASAHPVVIENHSLSITEGVSQTSPFGNAVKVENKTGTELPQTGAMGTTMFITFGMFAVLATGILLVTKKRMSMIVE